LKYTVHALWPRYIGERRTTFAKAYGIEVRCSKEHVGEHNGNLGNMWELTKNLGKHGGTHWEQRKNEKKILLHPHNLKGKKARHLECMLGPFN